jgi:hypothetical protein
MPSKIHASADASKPMLLSPTSNSEQAFRFFNNCPLLRGYDCVIEICGLDRLRKGCRRIVVETR